MSSFFTLPASQRKRKRDDQASVPATKKRGIAPKGGPSGQAGERRGKRQEREESISGSESDEDEIASGGESLEEDQSGSEEDETAADRRLRLAERYLENIREEVDEAGFDAAEIDRDYIAERLKEDVDESKGRVYRQIASRLSWSKVDHSYFRADTQTTTAVAIRPPFAYTVSKDKTLIKWELITPTKPSTDTTSKRPPRPQRKKPKKLRSVRGLQKSADGKSEGHTGNILTVAVSPSGQFVATGGADRSVIIWDADTLAPLKKFTQHRDAVSGLSFTGHISSSTTGEQLFSSSFDRTIKTWSLSPGGHAYVETLFGHQDHVVSVASVATDQCVSVGARDRTARLWKVVDETQLVFRGGASRGAQYSENSIDCVAAIPPSHFVTGSDDGSISLWSMHKKKPLYKIRQAHGVDPLPPLDEIAAEQDPNVAMRQAKTMRPTPRWITALAAVPGTDIVLSGSWDGWIRAWQVSEDKRTITPLGCVGKKNNLPSTSETPFLDGNPDTNGTDTDTEEQEPPLKGIVNDIAVFERRVVSSKVVNPVIESKAESAEESTGLCIVAALGKEHRLGRWKVFGQNDNKNNGGPAAGGRNGAVVFEVPFLSS